MSKGFPTPDMPSGDITYGCIPIFVPNNPEFQSVFASAIYGLYAEMSKEYFWRETGTMSVQLAAQIASYGLAQTEAYDVCGEGGTMSCLDIADCIETDETVQTAINQSITSDGFAPNPDTTITETIPPPSIPQADKDENLLPVGFDCLAQKALAMGLARTIVRELHETTEDFLELLEYATNTLEAWANVTSAIPAALTSVMTVALDWIDWILETFNELYQAAYTQDVEDELACAIFCALQTDCSLSLTDLENIYAAEGTIGTPPADLVEVLEFIYGIATSADKIAVAAFHYQILRLISWGKFAAFSAPYLKSILKSTQGSDNSFEDLCDDCVTPETPTDYWSLHFDFRVSQHGWQTHQYLAANLNGSYQSGGWQYDELPVQSSLNVNIRYNDLGANFVVRAYGTKSVRRGSSGNATHDYVALTLYGNTNLTAPSASMPNVTAISENSNEVIAGAIVPTGTFSTRSIATGMRVLIPTNSPLPHMLRYYELVIWGTAGPGMTKPARARWAGNTLPATVAELFPS